MAAARIQICEQSAKTPEKLVLNLIEFLLTKEEINSCTVNGNKQFNKQPMDFNKKKALQSKFVVTIDLFEIELDQTFLGQLILGVKPKVMFTW